MPLTSTITTYDPTWPQRFQAEKTRLGPLFTPDLLAIDHIGSTAVPGLAAKPEIDILVTVRSEEHTARWQPALAGLEYRRGGDLSPGHQFYKRDHAGVRTHKIHVITRGHPKIQALLIFRDRLRADANLRNQYQELKLRLERENKGGIVEYLDGKAPFIDAVVAGAATAKP